MSPHIQRSGSQFFSRGRRGGRVAMCFLGGVIISIMEMATQHSLEPLPPHTHCSNTEANKSAKVHQFWRAFAQLAGDDIKVSGTELMNVLNKVVISRTELKTHGFGIDTCQSMVAMMDSDITGKLDFEGFKYLWNNIKR
ncbi:calpain small subunit 1-like [Trachypithecus francoisi]|uniref:calpain small subunit 1-like n=1 Tax=Trachypithecus francoisi TaxID=54180 RepID=UPI00141B715C|nr:calpain small subunit 1-like [Trachypithecus francoisi]